MGVHDGHRKRLIRRSLEQGLDGFEPHQVLELLLFYAIPRQDTNVLAHRLTVVFGSLKGVFDAPYEQLLEVSGVGENTAALLKLIPQLTRLYFAAEDSDVIVQSAEAAAALLMPRFIGRRVELVYLISVDAKGRALSVDLIHEGSIHAAEANVRKIASVALRHNAAGVLLAHNHPGGMALPSREDILTTRTLRTALEAMDIQLLDHIIVADREFVSMRESGHFA